MNKREKIILVLIIVSFLIIFVFQKVDKKSVYKKAITNLEKTQEIRIMGQNENNKFEVVKRVIKDSQVIKDIIESIKEGKIINESATSMISFNKSLPNKKFIYELNFIDSNNELISKNYTTEGYYLDFDKTFNIELKKANELQNYINIIIREDVFLIYHIVENYINNHDDIILAFNTYQVTDDNKVKIVLKKELTEENASLIINKMQQEIGYLEYIVFTKEN